ncbi:MAG: sugar phosphate isomerase/epimerase [Clostridia bacterium]|nr:sugar phosphate isomerase/epimerase [Clostridia bacterium]
MSLKIGVLVSFNKNTDILAKFKEIKERGLQTCQVNIWDMSLYTDEVAEAMVNASKETGIEISTFWAGWRGPTTWNFYEGQYDLGLVPDEYRADRLEDLMLAADFVKKLGVKNLATHVGFLPENPADERYMKTVYALRRLCKKLDSYGIRFLFETGQETPVVLMRVMEDIGTGNLGVNLDTGNFILYGKANPVDALDMIGTKVYDVHLKDGLYPTDGKHLGQEVRFGDGKANFKEFLPKLKSLGYEGSLTIEREISGEKQIADIIYARDLIREYWK